MKLSLSYPIEPIVYTQHFGSNGAYYRANGINIVGHNGCDLLAFHGQPVYAPMDGMAYYEIDASGGHGVVIIGNEPRDYKDTQVIFKVILWHFCDSMKEPKYASPVYLAVGANTGNGTPVKRGDLVGHADSTGLSSGDHVHFGLKPITVGAAPFTGDAADVNIGSWINVEQDNGYLGAIDPEPYFDGTYVVTNNTPTAMAFTRDLSLGMNGDDVKKLQVYLNAHNCPVAASGAGSPGNETTHFGQLTQKALMRFQAIHGIYPVAGYFGPKTRAWVNAHP